MDVVVIDSGVGNLRSVAKAFEALGSDVGVSKDPAAIRSAGRIVLPGVGAFDAGMKSLQASGLLEVLSDEVLTKKKPFLGICLGMQLLAREGFENGQHPGLGWIPGAVQRLSVTNLPIPHVGWNDVRLTRKSPLFEKMPESPTFYFVHSYHLVCERPDAVLATCQYGGDFCSAVEVGNIAATQFHPEKSQKAGLQFLENFLKWRP